MQAKTFYNYLDMATRLEVDASQMKNKQLNKFSEDKDVFLKITCGNKILTEIPIAGAIKNDINLGRSFFQEKIKNIAGYDKINFNTVSTNHIKITFDQTKKVFILTDISTNGTYIMRNNIPKLLPKGQPVYLNQPQSFLIKTGQNDGNGFIFSTEAIKKR